MIFLSSPIDGPAYRPSISDSARISDWRTSAQHISPTYQCPQSPTYQTVPTKRLCPQSPTYQAVPTKPNISDWRTSAHKAKADGQVPNRRTSAHKAQHIRLTDKCPTYQTSAQHIRLTDKCPQSQDWRTSAQHIRLTDKCPQSPTDLCSPTYQTDGQVPNTSDWQTSAQHNNIASMDWQYRQVPKISFASSCYRRRPVLAPRTRSKLIYRQLSMYIKLF